MGASYSGESSSGEAERERARALPLFTRQSTGLVKEVGLTDQTIFSAAGTTPLGLALVFALFPVLLFPRANIFVAISVALVLGVFVWVTFALLSAAMPRIGGDYTFNSRILHPALGLGGNAALFISSSIATGLVASWVATQGLSPVFTVIGAVTDSPTLLRWGDNFSAPHQSMVFVTSVIAIVVLSALAIFRTRIALRTMTVMFAIAFVGFLIAMGILLFTSQESFRSTVDSAAGQGAYQKTVEAGADSGLYPTQGYSARSTIGAIYFILTVTMFTFWGTYLSAEFRRAGQRKRQLISMVGAGLGQGLLVLIGAAIFLHTVGYDFFVSSLSGNYAGPGGGTVGQAGYVYFASLVAGNSLIVTLLSLAFLGWMLPAVNINMAFLQRALMTWSFDGLLPRRVSDVDERTHTPIVAIGIVLVIGIATAAWASYSANFFQVFSIATLFAFFPVILTGLSAIVMKFRRPDLYKGSPADWRIGGIEILPIAGLGCLLTGCLAVILVFVFHTELGLAHVTLTWLAPILVFVGSCLWWLAARAKRRREGVDLDLVYKTIPPD